MQGVPIGLGDLGRLTQRNRNTIYQMVFGAENPLELAVEMDIYDVKYITIAQPAFLTASRAISNEATALLYPHSKFFVIVNGPSNTGKNLQDLQHGVDALLRLLTSRGARHLELTLQPNLMHGDLWQELDSDSMMKLANLAARRMVQVTINNGTIPVLGAAGQVANPPTINIKVPEQQSHVSRILTAIFHASSNHQTIPVHGGLHHFIESQLRAIPPSVPPSVKPSRFKLPHGLNIQTTPWYTLPDQGSQGLNITQEMANLRLRQAQLGTNLWAEVREAQLGWFRIILRSLGTHRTNLQMEIVNLARTEGGYPQLCFIGIGEGFRCYIRTMDDHSDEFLPVDSRLQLALNELECTRREIAQVNTIYQLMRPLNR